MPRCEGATASGKRCRHLVPQGRYCAAHRSQAQEADFTLVGVGVVLSQLIAPGFGPAIVGALTGKAVADAARPIRRKPRVFVSFDFDHDQALKHLFIGQARNSRTPFELVDNSLKEAAPERDWKLKARQKISGCDLVVVLVGAYTSTARGVLAEVSIAREEGKPIVQMVPATGGPHTRVPGAGRMIKWSWARLEAVLAKTA